MACRSPFLKQYQLISTPILETAGQGVAYKSNVSYRMEQCSVAVVRVCGSPFLVSLRDPLPPLPIASV